MTFQQQELLHPKSAVISLTDNCNLRCKYCFTNFNKRVSSYKIAEKTCEFLLNSKEGDEIPIIAFFGGEPLLEFDSIIKPIVEKYNGQISFSVTTNGTLLNEDIIDFLADNNVSVLLSIDGYKQTQNRQRPFADGRLSFDAVVENIPYLLLRMPNTVFRATLTKESIPELKSNIAFAEHMGFHYFSFIPNTDEDFDANDEEMLENQLDDICIDLIGKMQQNIMPKIVVQNLVSGIKLLMGELETGDGLNRSLNRCGLCTSAIGVDTEGNIHSCQECNSTQNFIFGTVFDGIDIEKRNEFLKEYQENYEKLRIDTAKKESNPFFALFLLNSLCPKKLYSDYQYNIPNSWYVYTKVLFNACLRLYKIYRYRATSVSCQYFGIDNFESGDIQC